MRFPTVLWGETRATFLPLGDPLPDAPITAALIFAMLENEFVLGDIAGRGWCIPGGRLEPGETPEEAAHREALEEIGATLGPLDPLGHYVLEPLASVSSTLSSTVSSTVSLASNASNTDTPIIRAQELPLAGSSCADVGGDSLTLERQSDAETHFVSVPHTQTPDNRLRLAIAYKAVVRNLTDLPEGTESQGVRRCSFADLPSVYYAWDPLLKAMFTYVYTLINGHE